MCSRGGQSPATGRVGSGETAFLRAMFDSAGDCIQVLDLDCNLIFMSEVGQRLMGVSDFDAVRARPWSNIWKQQARGDAQAAVEIARAGGLGRFRGALNLEARASKWWDVQVTLMLGEGKGPASFLCVSRDITDLIYAEERLSLAVNASEIVGVWDWDLKAGLVYANANFAQLHGVDPAWAARGAPEAEYLKVFDPDGRRVFETALDRLFKGNDHFLDEYRVIQPDQSVRWALASGRFFRNVTGEPLRLSGAAVDITGRKHLEKRQRLLMNELDHRLKNSLAMVQVMVSQTLRGDRALPDLAGGAGRPSARPERCSRCPHEGELVQGQPSRARGGRGPGAHRWRAGPFRYPGCGRDARPQRRAVVCAGAA